MTSSESNSSNTFEVNGVHMEIGEPDLIILPVPDKRGSANTYLQINISINNNLSLDFGQQLLFI